MRNYSRSRCIHILPLAMIIFGASSQTSYSQTTIKPCNFTGSLDLKSPYNRYAQYYRNAYSGEEDAGGIQTSISPVSASVSNSESSTAQSLDLIAERRAQDMQKCPAGFANIGGSCKRVITLAPDPTTANAEVRQSDKSEVETARRTKHVEGNEPVTAQAPSAVPWSRDPHAANDLPSSLKDEQATTEDIRYGVWVEGFYGYENQTGIPLVGGNLERTQHYYDALSGFDQITQIDAETSLKVGFLSGYTHTTQQYNSVSQGFVIDTFSITYGQLNGTAANGYNPDGVIRQLQLPNMHTIISSIQQTIDGPSVGFYGSYVSGGLFSDFIGRADIQTNTETGNQNNIFGDLSNHNNFKQLRGGGLVYEDSGCLLYVQGQLPPPPPNFDKAKPHSRPINLSTTENNYTIADNVGYRFDLPFEGFWFEPSVGAMYTYSDLGSNAADLGLKDGYTLRLQGGGRVGVTTTFLHDYIWTGSLAGILYSDVIVSGYDINNSGLGSASASADQGKPRVLGILQSRIDFLNGFSTYAELDTYGGSNLFGIGGRAGLRYQW